MNTDVTVQATRTGFEENVVPKSRQVAGYSVTVPGTAKGLRAKQSADGSVTFTDGAGEPASAIPAPVMWDATVDPRSLEHLHRAKVGMTVAQSGDTVNLTLTPDPAFLNAAGTRYPVTVDPSVNLSTVLDTFAQISYATARSRTGCARGWVRTTSLPRLADANSIAAIAAARCARVIRQSG